MIAAGIDIGSLSTKSVIIKDKTEILAYDVVLTGGNNRDSADKTFDNLLKKAGLKQKDINDVITTGYGRENVSFSNKNYSEITCHAKGMHFIDPNVSTLLDIGGQDSKAIRIDENGNVENFMMNDKCAAGCGRFLEIIARALGVELKDLERLSQEATSTTRISSMCSVFAETEVVSLVAIGTPIPNIIRGVHESIASRALSLLKMVGVNGVVGMSGGVAKNRGVVVALEDLIKKRFVVSDNPQIVGALGAALLA